MAIIMAKTNAGQQPRKLFETTILDVPWMTTAKVVLIWVAILVSLVAIHSFLVK
jgi:hypothetical protein